MILSLISICTVFACLLILYGVYSLSGAIFGGKVKVHRKRSPKKSTDEAETAAAIGMALSLYLSESSDRKELAGTITIRPSQTPWADKSLTFRKSPLKATSK